jgi:hypothetical protein
MTMLLIAGCNAGGGETSASLLQTQMALGVQATMMAQSAAPVAAAATPIPPAADDGQAQALQGTMVALQMTQMAQDAQAQTLALQATQNALTVAQATQPPVAAEPPTNSAPPPAAVEPPAVTGGDFDSWSRNASILLYEDMAGAEATGTYPSFRYVKKALDGMGVDYTDTGSAMGRFKQQITGGGPGGKGWDVVIMAAERKSGVSGEFFDYIDDALNRGSAVVIEVWYLDKISGGKVSGLLGRCGLKVQDNFVARNANEEAMYMVNASHPLLHEPNDGLSFSNVTSYWPYFITDLGDLMTITDRGDNEILVGTRGNEKKAYGTVMSCLGGQVIMQTFSSHQIAYDDMGLIWQNYVHHALNYRYNNLK